MQRKIKRKIKCFRTCIYGGGSDQNQGMRASPTSALNDSRNKKTKECRCRLKRKRSESEALSGPQRREEAKGIGITLLTRYQKDLFASGVTTDPKKVSKECRAYDLLCC